METFAGHPEAFMFIIYTRLLGDNLLIERKTQSCLQREGGTPKLPRCQGKLTLALMDDSRQPGFVLHEVVQRTPG